MQTISHVDINETPLDIKCGLVHNIAKAQTADALFDIKLALTSFDVRDKSGSVQEDDVLTQDFVERAQFRLWTGAKLPADGTAGTHTES